MRNKMKVAIFSFLILPSFAFAKKLEVDPNHSSINFEAIHLKVSKIPGRFTDFAGTINLDDKDITKSKVDFTVQVASINTAVPKRDDHLKSADFFDAEKFPKAVFKGTSIKKSGDNYELKGNLTIRNVTKPVVFIAKNLGTAEDPAMKAEKFIFQATSQINRKDFGVNYGPDAIVSDNIDLVINLETFVAAKK